MNKVSFPSDENSTPRPHSEDTFSPGSGQPGYRSSGRVSLIRFLPFFLLSVLVAGLMAIVLFIVHGFYYLFIFFPLLISVPVLGMLYWLIRIGHCRNRPAGLICGLILILIFYGGFWGLNYLTFLVAYEQEAQPILQETTGHQGFLGYLIFHCKNTQVQDVTMPTPEKEPSKADAWESGIFYALELLFLAGAGLAIPWAQCRRVFYETPKRWAAVKKVRFRPSDLKGLYDSVMAGDWQALRKLPKLAKIGNQQTSFAELEIEYLREDPAEEMYLTIKGMGMEKYAKAAGIRRCRGALEKCYLYKFPMPGSCLWDLSRSLPDLQLTELPPAPPAVDHAAEVLPVAQAAAPEETAAELVIQYSPGWKGKMEKAGLMAPKITGPDFREQAASVSRRLLGGLRLVRPEQVSFSFCLPVEEACQCSPKKLSRYPLYRSLCILAGILLGVILAATGTSFTKAGTDDLTAMGLALVIVGISFFVLGILWLIALFPLHSRYMKRQLLDRPGALFDLRDPPKLQRLYLENSHTYHIRKSSPDDLCLAALDPQRQCLWMEGCHYRYGIYGKDVVKLEPLESGQKVSLEIVYRIGGTELALVLYRESGTGMVLNPWIAKQFGKRFAGKFSRALGLEDQSF